MKNKKHILWSAVIAVGLLILTYFVGNIPYSFMGEKMLLKKVELLRKEKENKSELDDVLFVNVAFDKEARPYKDPQKGWTGTTSVTDRHKLLRFLQYLNEQEEIAQIKNETSYRYILFDVSFSAGVQTEWDDTLFSMIMSMPRIIIPYREGQKIADERLKEKAYLAKYTQSLQVAGFTKYPYYIKTSKCEREKTLPAAMFEEMTGRRIIKAGPLYFEGWHLAKRSCFLPLDVWPGYWQNLGMDVLGDTLRIVQSEDTVFRFEHHNIYNTPDYIKNKIIVIGSSIPNGDDMHNTFKGDLAGAALCYNAFYSMKEGQYRISPIIVLILFVVYFFLSFAILSNWKQTFFSSQGYKKLKKVCKIFTFFLLTLLGPIVILKLISLLIFALFGRVIETFFVSFVFSLMILIVKYNKQLQQ